MALKHVNAVIVGAGAGGGVVAKELATAGLSVVAAGARQMVFGRRLPQGRPAQPAHRRRSGNGSARMTNATRACWWTSRASTSSGPARAATATTRPAWAAAPSATARRPGATWRKTSACAPPTARWQAARSKTGPSATPTWSPTTRRPNGKWAFPATIRQHFQGAAPQAAAHAAAGAQPGAPDPAARGQTPRPASVRYPHAAQHRAVQRPPPCMRCRWCVGFACELSARTGTHNTVIPTGLADRQLRSAHDCMTR